MEIDRGLSVVDQQINKIIVHPSMPLAVTAHENRIIRLFDINQSNTYSLIFNTLVKSIKQTLAHSDGITSLVA